MAPWGGFEGGSHIRVMDLSLDREPRVVPWGSRE